MSDEVGKSNPAPASMPIAAVAGDGQTIFALARSIRRLKIWMAVLTTVLALALVSGVGIVGLWMFGIGMVPTDTVTDEQIADLEQEVRDAYGDSLQTVEVRRVEGDYGDTPFPFSLGNSYDMEVAYVSYQLKSSDVLIANIISPYGADLAASGMIPTQGSLASRLTEEQFARLLTAYGAETSKPLGSVFGYDDASAWAGESTESEVTVAGKKYPTAELWTATEGVQVEGDRYELGASSATAYVFHQDPVSGEFTFLGTEPGTQMW